MLRNLRPIASLLGGTALLLLGVGLMTTLIPLRGHALGFSTIMLGGLTSAYYAGYFIGTFALPPLIQRIGHIRAFAFCTACVTCLALLYTISTNPWIWLTLRLLTGGAVVGLYAIIESWLNAQAEPARRGTVFAAYMVVTLGSLAAAQQLLGINGQTFLLFSVVALLVSAATLPVVSTRQAQPVLQPMPRLRLRRLFALAPSAAAGALLSGLTMGAFWGLLPLYAAGRGFTLADVGTYMSVAILGGAALQWPLGHWSDRKDRRFALALVCTSAAALSLLQLVAADWHALAYLLIFLYGGMAFAIYPIVVAHLADQLLPGDLLPASSSVLLLFGIGSAIGPLAAGALMSAFGSWMLFGWFALIQLLAAGYSAYCYRHVKREQGSAANFRVMLRTTPTAFDMLPETAPATTDTGAGRDDATRTETAATHDE